MPDTQGLVFIWNQCPSGMMPSQCQKQV